MDNEDYTSIMLFENKLLKSKGQEFEDLFTTLMQQVYPSKFKPISPYGNIGDRKNDGYIKGEGIFFQVYAPNNLNDKRTLTNAIKKLDMDFKGLLDYWDKLEKVKKYYFVINDKLNGVDIRLHKKILKLQNEYIDIEINIISLSELIEYFRNLEIDRKYYILSSIPINNNMELNSITIDVLSKIIKYIIENFKILENIDNNRLQVPEFDKKLKVNNLTIFRTVLKNADYQCGIIDKFYSYNPEDKSILQKKVISLYIEQVKDGNRDDMIFLKMSDKMIPNKEEYKEYNHIEKKLIMDAIYVVLSYFFQACDIGEPPSEELKEYQKSLFNDEDFK